MLYKELKGRLCGFVASGAMSDGHFLVSVDHNPRERVCEKSHDLHHHYYHIITITIIIITTTMLMCFFIWAC